MSEFFAFVLWILVGQPTPEPVPVDQGPVIVQPQGGGIPIQPE